MAADLGNIKATFFLLPLKDRLEVWLWFPLFELNQEVIRVVDVDFSWPLLPGDSTHTRLVVVHVLDENISIENTISKIVTGSDHSGVTSQRSKESCSLILIHAVLRGTGVVSHFQTRLRVA